MHLRRGVGAEWGIVKTTHYKPPSGGPLTLRRSRSGISLVDSAAKDAWRLPSARIAHKAYGYDRGKLYNSPL